MYRKIFSPYTTTRLAQLLYLNCAYHISDRDPLQPRLPPNLPEIPLLNANSRKMWSSLRSRLIQMGVKAADLGFAGTSQMKHPSIISKNCL